MGPCRKSFVRWAHEPMCDIVLRNLAARKAARKFKGLIAPPRRASMMSTDSVSLCPPSAHASISDESELFSKFERVSGDVCVDNELYFLDAVDTGKPENTIVDLDEVLVCDAIRPSLVNLSGLSLLRASITITKKRKKNAKKCKKKCKKRRRAVLLKPSKSTRGKRTKKKKPKLAKRSLSGNNSGHNSTKRKSKRAKKLQKESA